LTRPRITSPWTSVNVLARRLVAVLLLALWLPATQHCDLEAAGVMGLDHEHHGESAEHAPCPDHACHTLEEIGWVKDFDSVRVLPPCALPLLDLLITLSATPLKSQWAYSGIVTDAAPELLRLSRTWVFTRRAAWPSRAPSFGA